MEDFGGRRGGNGGRGRGRNGGRGGSLQGGGGGGRGTFLQAAQSRAPAMQSRGWGRGGSGRGDRVQYIPVRAPAMGPSSSEHHPGGSSSPALDVRQRLPMQRPDREHHPGGSSSPALDVRQRLPMQRPDRGGSSCIYTVNLLVNHFLLNYNDKAPILHYEIDVKPDKPRKGKETDEVSKSELASVKNELFRANQGFSSSSVAYDGERNLYSAIELPSGQYKVQVGRRTFTVNVEFKKMLALSRLAELPVPREVLQGLDVVVREASSWQRIVFGRSFYSITCNNGFDLGRGIIAMPGYQQSVKQTEQGVVLCVDYSVLPFRKPMSVLHYLAEHLGMNFDANMSLSNERKSAVLRALKGSQVTVTHRRTNQKYTVFRLTDMVTNSISFIEEESKREVRLVDFFKEKYKREIKYKWLPCLELSKGKMNYVPMEFCQLIEGQKYPKERLYREQDKQLRDIALVLPKKRKELILKTIEATDGPCRGNIADQFKISVSKEMTPVTGRVLERPDLRLGNSNGQSCRFKIDKDDCQWNLLKNKILKGQNIERWAILDFSATPEHPRQQSLDTQAFIQNLVKRCRELGINMQGNPFIRKSDMSVLSNVKRLYQVLTEVRQSFGGHSAQLLICPMADRHAGYKDLKRICETELGIMTQCCLSYSANNPKGKDQYFANLALKINAKLGGSNMELYEEVPHMTSDCPYMFIGADVNHPTSSETTVPSIAAVVGSMNFPQSNSYATRFDFQEHRKERILKVGQMCSELIDEYARVNGFKPQKIVYFRDGVSDGQFLMVLNEELEDIKNAIESNGYSPSFTVVVAKKRHNTRLFPKDESVIRRTRAGNVPPGTCVDTKIVDLCVFNFFLCSHYGNLGTSRPTHYYGLLDDHGFTSDELQKLVFNLCFTFPKCTKPISLVPPVYYADLAAYRARLYLECLMDSQQHAWKSSAAAVKELGSLLKLHHNVKNQMYYL